MKLGTSELEKSMPSFISKF